MKLRLRSHQVISKFFGINILTFLVVIPEAHNKEHIIESIELETHNKEHIIEPVKLEVHNKEHIPETVQTESPKPREPSPGK
jgi:hypothetical protein